MAKTSVVIRAGGVKLIGDLVTPAAAKGLILFAHGSGSSRFSARNLAVAETLNQSGLGSWLFDLLTAEEEIVDTCAVVSREGRPDLARIVLPHVVAGANISSRNPGFWRRSRQGRRNGF